MSQSQEEVSKNFITEFSDYLRENKLKEALAIFEGSDYETNIELSWDIIHITSTHLTNENAECNKELIECCTIILNAIAEKCNPSEIIIVYLEQVEDTVADIKFCTLLKVVGKCLSRMPDKTKAIEWCISTIRSYVEGLPLPEKESENNETIINKIQNIYGTILLFLEVLVDEAALENDKMEKEAMLRDYLLSGLIFLLGRPLCYLQEKDIELHLSQPLPEKIIMSVNRMIGDLLWFLNFVTRRSRKMYSKKKTIDEESSNLKLTLFELNENVPDLAYANFYFYIITELHLWEKVPQVYDLHYIFQACVYLIIKMLQEQKNIVIAKGLILMDHLLKRLTKRSLTSELLELNIYTDLIDILIKVMIYCDSDKERKKALNVFQEYIEMFDMQSRYLIVLHLYQTSEHSGLLSFTTGIFKASIIECLQATPSIPYFLGNNLESLLNLACKLPHGSASDLVELSDEIITSLNLLRFLFLRDKCNETGVWNLVNKLENNYLKPLREGINLCKAHWKVKIKDLEYQKKTQKISDNTELEKINAEITLTVGGQTLPAMPVPEKISFCYQALNGLDVMESILIRVNECIASNPLKQYNNNTVILK
ncbi:glomulin [Calliopsis andreniformis]|uniref:glomulin n=1 Tax=Calliopsis andreniformis TaxID=337506 RepID=UPI003FCE0B70